MADRIISAEAIITGKDATGDMFASIARKVQGMSKGLNSSVQIDGLVKSLQRAEAQMKALDRFQAGQKGFADARTRFNAASAAVTQAARAMKDAEGPSRQLAASYAAAQRAVVQASSAFEKQKGIVKAAKQELEAFGSPVGKIASEQARLKTVIDATTRSIEHQAAAERKAVAAQTASVTAHRAAERAQDRRREGMRHHGVANYALGAAAGAVSAHGVFRGVEYALHKGADRQHVRVGAINAGIPAEEVARMEASASSARAGAPNMSTTQIMELHKEARSAVQHPEEAFHLIPDLAKAASVLKGMGVQDANIADLVKGGESLGLMNDPKRFHRYLEGQVKAMAVMGKTINTSQIYEAAKYSKSAGATLSDDFLNLTMPSLIQEMHGSSAGDALSMLTKTFRGGMQHKHLPVERLNSLGLLEDPSKIRRAKKTGQIMGYGGKVVGDDMLASSPDKWFQDVFNPAAEKGGFKTLADKVKLLSEVLPSTAANLGRIFLQQEDTLKQHRRNYEAAPGLDEASANQRKDPKAGVMALQAALDDLASAVTGPGMLNAAKGINHLSEGIRSLSQAAEKHPGMAMASGAVAGGAALGGAGYMAYQVSRGFGLTTSAGALSGAAGELTIAAARLGAAGIPGKTPPGSPTNLLTKAPVVAPVGLGAMAATGAALGIGGLGVAAGVGANALLFGAMYGLKAIGVVDDTKKDATAGPMRAREAEERAAMARIEAARPSKYTRGGRMTKMFIPNYGSEPYGPPMPQEQFGPAMPSPMFNNVPMPPGRPHGAGGPIEVKVPPVEVTSHSDTKVQVSITAAPGISASVTNQTTVTRPGTGKSMPGAASGGAPAIDGYL